MKRMLLGFAISLLVSLPVLAALKVGDMAPNFSARGSLGGKEFDFSLQEALKKGPVVVYFFPSAYTKGCDLEAHTFSQDIDKFDRCRSQRNRRIGGQYCAAESLRRRSGILRRKVSGRFRHG